MTPLSQDILPRTCVRPAHWPEVDQRRWNLAITPRRGPFRSEGGGGARNPYTIRKTTSGYGRWVGFLGYTGQLDPADEPRQRVTHERLGQYFQFLQACGNADYTILARFSELYNALRWMYPGEDFSHVVRPHGVSIRGHLPMRRRTPTVPDSAVLLAWAEELFAQASLLSRPASRRAQIREAVIIALLATRAPRLRTLTAFKIDTHLRHDGNKWILDQTADITKQQRQLVLPISEEVRIMLDRYLTAERQELLQGESHDSVWISTRGKPLAEATISSRLRRRTKQRFGVAFGPHLFRASLATTLALDSPGRALDASTLLGHSSPQTTINSYNRASASAAARRHGDRLQRLRRATTEVQWSAPRRSGQN